MKYLGKIESAEIVIIRGFLLGPDFTFTFDKCCGIGSGGKYSVNMSKECKWENENQKLIAIKKAFTYINDLMQSAKIEKFSDLNGMPVEIEVENNTFKDFRILTEVI